MREYMKYGRRQDDECGRVADAASLDSIATLYEAMLADVDSELEACDDQRPRVDAEVLREIDAGPAGTRYELALARRMPQLDEGDSVKLLFGLADEMPGTVESVSGTHIVVMLSQQLPKLARHRVRVSPDDRWLLERLRKVLKRRCAAHASDRADDDFNDELARLVIGHGNYDDNTAPAALLSPADRERILDRLNEDQRDAVDRALMSRAFYLSGPPGTGKTTTVVAYVEAQLQAGRRVLVTAPSNAAADVLTLALAGRLHAADGFGAGRILLRVGRRPIEAVRQQWGDRVLPDAVAERLAALRYEVPAAQLASSLEEAERAVQSCRQQSRARQRAVSRHALYSAEGIALDRARAAAADAEFATLLEEARIVVTPIQNMYLSPKPFGEFDVVVVDECSMVTLPQLWLAAGKARVSVLAAGDHMQLPAPRAARGRRSEEARGQARAPRNTRCVLKGCDIFVEAGLAEAIAKDEYLPHLAMLTTQHRMRPEICDLVSEVFYGGRLRTAGEVKRRPSFPWPWGLGSVLLIDTSALWPTAENLEGTRSRVNEVHLDVVRSILRTLAEEEPGELAGRMIVTSPFRAQVDILREALDDEDAAPTDLHVTTVHQAQGDEARSVILTLDDGYGEEASRFITARDLTDEGAKLLNVGLSRARDRLLILADVDYLEDEGGPIVRRLIHAMRDRGCVVPVADVIPTHESGFVEARRRTVARRRQAAASKARPTPAPRQGHETSASDSGES